MNNEFKAWAIAPGANVEDQAHYEADPALAPGASSGLVPSAQYNKIHRQATFVAAFIQQFVSDMLQIDVHDDGDSAGALANFEAALRAWVGEFEGNFYTWNGNPNTHVAGIRGTATNPPDLCEDYTNNNLYMCTVSGDAATAQWQLINIPPGASGVVQIGGVVANHLAAWSAAGAIKDSNIDMATVMFEAVANNVAAGHFPMGGASGFVDSNAGQKNCVFWGGTTTGSANSQSCTIAPMPAAMAPPSIICIKAGFTNTGAMVFNPGVGGALAVRKSSAGGPIPLAGGEWGVNNFILLGFDGTFYNLLGSVGGGAAIQTTAAPYGKTKITVTNGGNANTQLAATIANIVLSDASGNLVNCKALTGTCDFATNGANGLDTGARAGSSGYYLHAISDGAGNFAQLGSLSLTNPTFPGGYSYFAPIAWVPTDSSTNFYRIRKRGHWTQFAISAATNTANYPLLRQGAFTGAIAVAGVSGAFAPPDVCEMSLRISNDHEVAAFGSSSAGSAPQYKSNNGGDSAASEFYQTPVRFLVEGDSQVYLSLPSNTSFARVVGFGTDF